MNDPSGVLMIFTRDPVPGETKTRLIPLLGEQGAAELHDKMLSNVLEVGRKSRFEDIQLWSYSSCFNSLLENYEQKYTVQLIKQTGRNLGERMHHAFATALKNYDFAVLTGSDCPMITTTHLNNAYHSLYQGMDAVLGPSEDGGYYLLGLRQNNVALFNDIPWGGSSVADITRQRISSLAWQLDEIETLWDVDTPADYKKLLNIETVPFTVNQLS